nr:MAG TPA: Nickel responsive protein responsive protein, Structural Genomics.3A [Caudoviricetes sp.]
MENSKFITSWQEVHTIVDDAMTKGNRSVTIYISPDGGMSIAVFPWPDEETLRAAYEQGKISYNDYRTKLGLSLVRDQGGGH